ncbi:MAG TPA: anaerobic glycerol-3-phosphate dehydrogenase subunit C [Pirellulales bacterium]|jgi:anaerobic glycerol-3-phosphate dehydrogenase C subunit|nr:anaerobic glycerol-3-phosphate dehydrogenase subunit C [Pirellulales bacterium]
MDQERQRIQDDLRGLVSGDVRCDDVFVQLYASDASVYQIRPLGVVRPRNSADVVATLQYAAEKKIPIHARGAGTGLAGESLGAGLILDFSRYMRRILRIDDDRVRVQPGVVHAQLNQHLRSFGRLFGPDPAMSQVTTMGSVVAIDASGSHWLQYGSARRHVLSLQIVLADGTLLEVGREPLSLANVDVPTTRRQELVSQLTDLFTRRAQLISERQPQTMLNQCGYQLGDVLESGSLDLGRLLAGSEGTLAIITEATLATTPLPRYRGVGALFFDSLENAALAVQEILPFSPCACDLLDRRHLSLARENYPEYSLLVPAEAEALLLVEHMGDDPVSVRDRMVQMLDRVRRKCRLAFDTRQAFDHEEIDLYWQLATRIVPTLHRIKGTTRPLPFVEDLAVPPAALPDFLVRMQNTLKKHQVTASLFGHVGHGQLHVRPFLDLTIADDVRKMEDLAADLYHEVFEVHGTISGEHGDGLSRTPFIRRQYGELYDVFAEVKQVFDPQGILNPGKIVGGDGQSLTRHLRPVRLPSEEVVPSANGRSSAPPALVDVQLNWTPAEIAAVASHCNGCGSCRAQSGDLRMCPIFRVAPAEEASPRAKANLFRGLLSGQLDPALLTTDDFKDVADLCVNCHQCRLECPAGVDIPKLMIEAKAAYVATNGLQPSDWILARFDILSALGSHFSPVANWAVGNRQARWLLEKTFGIAQGRKLPRFAPRSFLRRAARRRLTRPTRRSGRKVVYFVDTYANYHDPQLAEALVAVLEHNGVAVYVPPNQRASGMAMISMGAVERARRLAAKNVALLAEAVRQGYQVVVTEPSTAVCLTHEYPNLMDDEEARLVAQNTTEACTYLWRLHQQGILQLDLRPVNAALAYHMPCHIKALGVGSPTENLLRLVPALSVQRIEKGCSGMAGTFGLKKANYRTSLRAGWELISHMRQPGLQAGTTECSACKMQMEQGTTKPTLHPLKLLAMAYGLMPELAGQLTARGAELVVT